MIRDGVDEVCRIQRARNAQRVLDVPTPKLGDDSSAIYARFHFPENRQRRSGLLSNGPSTCWPPLFQIFLSGCAGSTAPESLAGFYCRLGRAVLSRTSGSLAS